MTPSDLRTYPFFSSALSTPVFVSRHGRAAFADALTTQAVPLLRFFLSADRIRRGTGMTSPFFSRVVSRCSRVDLGLSLRFSFSWRVELITEGAFQSLPPAGFFHKFFCCFADKLRVSSATLFHFQSLSFEGWECIYITLYVSIPTQRSFSSAIARSIVSLVGV